ncbi:hypothetical protein HW555_013501 [Spodoptera exigua]|uniref:Uncharacterized protein n=1 Tax=Spodoptera exigua TaxID=7107 RepID=A0A835KY33_SPOEX|nr:hypothetical protein HW555_013501 [Spodoptera exigua]
MNTLDRKITINNLDAKIETIIEDSKLERTGVFLSPKILSLAMTSLMKILKERVHGSLVDMYELQSNDDVGSANTNDGKWKIDVERYNATDVVPEWSKRHHGCKFELYRLICKEKKEQNVRIKIMPNYWLYNNGIENVEALSNSVYVNVTGRNEIETSIKNVRMSLLYYNNILDNLRNESLVFELETTLQYMSLCPFHFTIFRAVTLNIYLPFSKLRVFLESNSVPINITGSNEVEFCIKNIRQSLNYYSNLLNIFGRMDKQLQLMIINLVLLTIFIEMAHSFIKVSSEAVIVEMIVQEVDQIKQTLTTQMKINRDESIRFELATTLQYIKLRPFRYDICRIVPLNIYLPFSIISFCITYVIVALQLTHFNVETSHALAFSFSRPGPWHLYDCPCNCNPDST